MRRVETKTDRERERGKERGACRETRESRAARERERESREKGGRGEQRIGKM